LNAIKKAEELKDTGEIKITTPINKKLTQQVSLKAAIANVKGLIQFAMEDFTAANASFQVAITLEPEFKLAKDNLAAAREGEKNKKKK